MSALTVSLSAFASGEVNLYTTREPRLIQPLLEAFEKDTGIKTNTVFIKDGLPERIKSEGERSPADVLMTVDIGKLLDVVDQDLVQPVDSKTLKEIIPENLRAADDRWFAFSLRDRVLYAAKELDLDTFTYEDLADPKWKNRVCIRSGQHPYNTSLIAAMIAHDGVGLAAPQVGRNVRVAVVEAEEGDLIELINPEVIESHGSDIDVEGCLSIPHIYGTVARPDEITVRYYDREGDELEMTCFDFLARAVQHEIDHLNGILFIDKLITYLIKNLKCGLS